MQIVIDIPKTIYTNIKSSFSIKLSDANTDKVIKAIKNGTPLPKGHGKLIDAAQLMNYCQNQIDGHKYADCNVIARFPVVLNAEVSE